MHCHSLQYILSLPSFTPLYITAVNGSNLRGSFNSISGAVASFSKEKEKNNNHNGNGNVSTKNSQDKTKSTSSSSSSAHPSSLWEKHELDRMGQINSMGQPVKMSKNAPPNVADFYGVEKGLGQRQQKASSSSQSGGSVPSAAGEWERYLL